jgi:branched-chain amino acid transport system substrate-binding protein
MGRQRMLIRKVGLGAMLLLGLAALLAGGCAKSGQTRTGSPEPTLAADQVAQAQRLYAQLKREHSLHRDRKSLELAGTLLDYYPTFERNDEVLSLAVQSAYRLEDLRLSLELTDEFLERFPASPLTDHRLARGAEIALDAGDTLTAAGYLIRHYDRGPERATRSDGTPRAAPVLRSLSADQIDRFLAAEHGLPMWPYLAYLQVEMRIAEGDYGRAEAIGDQMAVLDDDNHWLQLARGLLQGGQPAQVVTRPSGPVNVNRVGVLSPLTGRYAVLGNAFVDACLMALEQANSETGRTFELLVEDTAGNPVNSALAARRLCGEDGSMAMFGALMSDPTATAALVADLYGVPLVSPTATNDRVWQLGEGIFQTNLTGFYEVRLLAQLATTVMLKQRFAVIFPDDEEGRRNAEVFAAEVEHFGGEVVAMASFPPQGTDFREPILKLKQHRPEVVFAPATVDQMVLLGPQLDFYRAGSLVLGLSNWNSQKLIDRAGTQLERAIFPSDQALIPPQWTAEFNLRWDDSNYPREATALALRAYQSMRMLLDTMHTSGAANRTQLAEALTKRLANRSFEAEGPDSFASIVRMYSNKRIVPFPADLYTEAWELTEAALADTLIEGELTEIPGADPADPVQQGEPEFSPEGR